MLDHGLVVELFARFTRLVVKKTGRRSATAVAESEKSIARFEGMYNIRFDLAPTGKLNR